VKSDLDLVTVTGLTIPVTGGIGSAPTALAAFDEALRSVGVHNFNLIRLSSVIPPGSEVIEGGVGPGGRIDLTARERVWSNLGWGDRLYAVWALATAQLLGAEAWAGVAWVQDVSDGRGLFVEHEGGSESQVREELASSLTSISAARGLEHLPQRSVVVGARCEGNPVAALVIAPFLSEPWETRAPLSG